jgi:hypothetical protein
MNRFFVVIHQTKIEQGTAIPLRECRQYKAKLQGGALVMERVVNKFSTLLVLSALFAFVLVNPASAKKPTLTEVVADAICKDMESTAAAPVAGTTCSSAGVVRCGKWPQIYLGGTATMDLPGPTWLRDNVGRKSHGVLEASCKAMVPSVCSSAQNDSSCESKTEQKLCHYIVKVDANVTCPSKRGNS